MRNQVCDVPQLFSLLRFHLVVFNVSSPGIFLLSWKSSSMSLSLLQNPESWKVHRTMRIWNFQAVLLVAYTVFLVLIIPAFSILRAAVQVQGTVPEKLLTLSRISKRQKMPSPSWSPPQCLLPSILRYTASDSSTVLHNKPHISFHISRNFYIYDHLAFKCFLWFFFCPL